VCLGDLVQRHDRVNSGRQLARRGAGEQAAQSRTVGVRYDGGYGDPAFRLRLGVGLDADEHPAVAEQGEATLLQRRTVGDRVPARLDVRATRVPIAKFTPGPTAPTMPAKSQPRPVCLG
jgi:hypothetical protein